MGAGGGVGGRQRQIESAHGNKTLEKAVAVLRAVNTHKSKICKLRLEIKIDRFLPTKLLGCSGQKENGRACLEEKTTQSKYLHELFRPCWTANSKEEKQIIHENNIIVKRTCSLIQFNCCWSAFLNYLASCFSSTKWNKVSDMRGSRTPLFTAESRPCSCIHRFGALEVW